MSSKIYTPSPSPVLEDAKPPAVLTENEEDMRKKVFEHFSKPDYAIPGVEHGELTDNEKFWLVRHYFLVLVCTESTLTRIFSRMNACYGASLWYCLSRFGS